MKDHNALPFTEGFSGNGECLIFEGEKVSNYSTVADAWNEIRGSFENIEGIEYEIRIGKKISVCISFEPGSEAAMGFLESDWVEQVSEEGEGD